MAVQPSRGGAGLVKIKRANKAEQITRVRYTYNGRHYQERWYLNDKAANKFLNKLDFGEREFRATITTWFVAPAATETFFLNSEDR